LDETFRLAYYDIEKQISIKISVEKSYLQNLYQNFLEFWKNSNLISMDVHIQKKRAQNLSYAFQSKKCFKKFLLKNQSIASKPL